jgi:hypothetical protein
MERRSDRLAIADRRLAAEAQVKAPSCERAKELTELIPGQEPPVDHNMRQAVRVLVLSQATSDLVSHERPFVPLVQLQAWVPDS